MSEQTWDKEHPFGTPGVEDWFLVQSAGASRDTRILKASDLLFSKPVQNLAALKSFSSLSGQVYLVGLYSDGDGGEGVFIWSDEDLSSEVTSDPRSAVYVPPNADSTGASGAWVRQHNGTVDIRCFGAVGDGVTNSTESFQAAFDLFYARSDLSALLIPAGTYLSEEIVFPRLENVEIVGEGYPVIRFISETEDAVMWEYSPSSVAIATPSVDINAGDDSITFAEQPSNVQVGDIVYVATDKNLYDTGNTDLKAGILKEVVSVGAVVGLRGESETTIATTDSPVAYFYRPLRNLTISGIRFELSEDAAQRLIELQKGASKGVLVKDCEVIGPGQNRVGISISGFDIRITRCRVEGFLDDTGVMGYGLAHAGHRSRIDNCYIYGCKHGVVSGSNLRVSTDLHIINNTVQDPQKEGLDFHGGCWHCSYVGNTILDMGKSHAAAGGFSIKGHNISVLHNRVYAADDNLVSCAVFIGGPASDNIRIIGNIFKGRIAYPIKGNTIDGDGYTNLEIKDNVIDCQGIAGAGVRGIDLSSKYLVNGVVSGNLLLGLDAHGMSLCSCENTVITNNLIEYGIIQAGRGIGVETAPVGTVYKGLTIANNVFKPMSTSAGGCVRIFNKQDEVIFIGNRQDTSIHTAYRLLQDSTTSGIPRLVQIGNINDELTETVTYNPASLANGASVATTVSLLDVALGDFASASFSLDLQGVSLSAYVSSANTVTVRFTNNTGGTVDLASGTIRVTVVKNRVAA